MVIDEKLLIRKSFPPKTMLIKEGTTTNEMMLIKSGCIRAWYNADGQEITLQFFFEGDSVTSLQSFLNGIASDINIETLEECEVLILKKVDFEKLLATDSAFKDFFYKAVVEKLLTHTGRLLSLLKNKPFDRYQALLAENPKIFQRIPQHYIASYLGMTPVSLSRIRNRKVLAS